MTGDVPSIRASNADRERVAAIVSDAAAKGMLTLTEADERLGQVYAARYLSDLVPITADLPNGGAHLAPVDPSAKSAERAAARQAVVRRVGMYAGPYLGLVALLTTIWALSGAGYFWPVWPILFLGIGTFRQAAWGSGAHRDYRDRRDRDRERDRDRKRRQ
jgi:hypothetical protein